MRLMDRDFFKFSVGALGLIAVGLVIFYFLERARYEREGTAAENKMEAASAIEAVAEE